MVPMRMKMTVGVVSTTTLFTTLLLPLLVSLPPPAVADAIGHSWRYVFPFFPAELDILVGHLRTTVTRLEDVLEQCEEMVEGEWTGADSHIGVLELSADDNDEKDNGDDDDNMEKKVEQILELREIISELEDKIEECRFHFWTGAED